MLLKLPFLQNHRREVGIYLLYAAMLIQFLTSKDLLDLCAGATGGFCGHILAAQVTLATIGGYVATVGTIFKNDPPYSGGKP